jgi:hypothetical protein
MFRAKTKKATSKKNSNVSGPITPIKNNTLTKVDTAVATATDVSGNIVHDVSGVNVAPVTALTALTAATATTVPVNQRNNTVMNADRFFSDLLDAESKSAVHRPWLRLERGIRMKLLRSYVEKRTDLNATERIDLLVALVEGLDKKLLNSKSQITYNTDTGDIVEINALKIIHPTNSKTVFRIEPPNRSTKKVRRNAAGSDSE